MQSSRMLCAMVLGAAMTIATAPPARAVGGPNDPNAVNVCTLNWPPFVASYLPNEGLLNALTRAAFDAAGRKMVMEFMPWARAMHEVYQGDRDMVQAAYFNETRDKRYIFTEPLYPTRVGLIALKSSNLREFDSLRDLTEYSIGYARGFTISSEFDAAEYLNKQPVENNRLNIRKLYKGRIDLIAMNFDVFQFLVKDEGLDPDLVVFLDPILAEHKIYLMASRAIPDGQEIVKDFNTGLARIKATGKYARIVREMGYVLPETAVASRQGEEPAKAL